MSNKSEPTKVETQEEAPTHNCTIMGENTPLQKGIDPKGNIEYVCIWCAMARHITGEDNNNPHPGRQEKK